jgi:hypothetical protein
VGQHSSVPGSRLLDLDGFQLVAAELQGGEWQLAVGHGFRNFTNYRLRLLLHCGVRWQTHRTARLRARPLLSAVSRC